MKERTELDGVEQYVYDLMKDHDYSWIPRSRALVLESQRQKREQDRVDSETRELRERLDGIYKELHRMRTAFDYEMYHLRVCVRVCMRVCFFGIA